MTTEERLEVREQCNRAERDRLIAAHLKKTGARMGQTLEATTEYLRGRADAFHDALEMLRGER